MKPEDVGEPDKMYIGGVCSLYRAFEYDGMWEHGVRQGHGECRHHISIKSEICILDMVYICKCILDIHGAFILYL